MPTIEAQVAQELDFKKNGMMTLSTSFYASDEDDLLLMT